MRKPPPELTKRDAETVWNEWRERKARTRAELLRLAKRKDAAPEGEALTIVQRMKRIAAREDDRDLELAVQEARWARRDLDYLLALPEAERGKRAHEIAAVARRLGYWNGVAAQRLEAARGGRKSRKPPKKN